MNVEDLMEKNVCKSFKKNDDIFVDVLLEVVVNNETTVVAAMVDIITLVADVAVVIVAEEAVYSSDL